MVYSEKIRFRISDELDMGKTITLWANVFLQAHPKRKREKGSVRVRSPISQNVS